MVIRRLKITGVIREVPQTTIVSTTAPPPTVTQQPQTPSPKPKPSGGSTESGSLGRSRKGGGFTRQIKKKAPAPPKLKPKPITSSPVGIPPKISGFKSIPLKTKKNVKFLNIIQRPKIQRTNLRRISRRRFQRRTRVRKVKGGFNVFGKPFRKRNLVKLNVVPLSKKDAVLLRNYVLDTSLARTGSIVKTKKRSRNPVIKVPKKSLAKKFRKSAVKKGKVTERKKNIKDTLQEKKMITLKIRLKNLKKARAVKKRKKR